MLAVARLNTALKQTITRFKYSNHCERQIKLDGSRTMFSWECTESSRKKQAVTPAFLIRPASEVYKALVLKALFESGYTGLNKLQVICYNHPRP